MSDTEYWDEVYSLAQQYADEYVRNAVDEMDNATRNDPDAFHEAIHEIECCLKGEMRDFVREADAEVSSMLA